MPRLTLLHAKEALAKKSQADEIEFRLNRVCERLITHGKFNGAVQRVGFIAQLGNIALPQQYRTILGVKVDGLTCSIANHWYTFLPGNYDCSCFSMSLVEDLGDGHALMVDLPLAGTLALAYSGTDAQVATLYGYDATGIPISLTITGAAPVANPFTTIERVHKELIPVAAPAALTLRHAAADNTVTDLAIMAPQEEETFYRRYLVRGSENATESTIEALCKRRHVEFTSDQDVLPFANLSVLSLGLDALQMESENDTTLRDKYFEDAVDILNLELADSHAVDELPPFRFVYPAGTAPRFKMGY